jgi:DNA-binding MarR family transcriptional regulator
MVIFDEKRILLLIKLATHREYKGVKHLSKGIYSSDSSCVRALDEFENRGLVCVEKVGRKHVRAITPKGKEIFVLITDIQKLLNSG